MEFVHFGQALVASKNGELVRFHAADGSYLNLFDYVDAISESGLEEYSFSELLEGKWEIVKDREFKEINT